MEVINYTIIFSWDTKNSGFKLGHKLKRLATADTDHHT